MFPLHGSPGGREGPAWAHREEPKSEALGAMRKLFTLILLVGAFCGGYQFGHQPGAPDPAPFAKKCCVQASHISRRVARWASAKWEEINASPTDQGVASACGGETSQEQQD